MGGSRIEIRRLGRPGDLGWVVMAHGEVYAAEFGWDASFEALVARIVADYAAGHDPAREAAWIAEIDGRRAGCVFCVAADEATAQLRILLVYPSARGHRLGEMLVDECVAFARQAGYERMKLWTNHPLVAARRIYLSRGFRLVEEEPHHSFGADLVGQVYELDLPPGQPGITTGHRGTGREAGIGPADAPGTVAAVMDVAGFAGFLASPPVPPEASWRAACVQLSARHKGRLEALCRERGIRVLDTIDRQLAELATARFPGPHQAGERSRFTGRVAAGSDDLAGFGLWVYLPWAAQVAHVLGPDDYLEVVTNRNRNKITRSEQAVLRTKRIGVLGLSVGGEAAVTIAQEHLCGHLVLADFDRLDLSNLNRLGASCTDIGLPKTKIAARRIAAIDPYLTVTVVEDEVTAANAAQFVAGLDLLVEECDGMAAKYGVREAARAGGVNVVYAADERGFLSVEPYRMRPGLPLFHGLVGPDLATSVDRMTALAEWLGGPSALSERSRCSLALIGTELSGYPQLASEARYAAGQIGHVARRMLLGENLPPFHRHLDLADLVPAT